MLQFKTNLNKTMKNNTIKLSLLAFCFVIFSCQKTEDAMPTVQVPASYNFENVNFSGQTQRLNMLTELSNYIKTANTAGVKLDILKLKNMFSNTGAAFSKNYEASKQLKDKCFEPDRVLIEQYFGELVKASQATAAGSNGKAGVVVSKDGTKKYLFDEKGFEYAQLIEKTLMGAVCYYQATSVYLSDDKIGNQIDNAKVIAGEGTAMEHHWDEAFGYFGVPLDFPTNLNGIRFFGKYANDRNAKIACNDPIMKEGFLKGRAAISAKNMKQKEEAVVVIRTQWERVLVSTALYYLAGAKRDFADDALRNHQLSEGIAFIKSLKYNSSKKITNEQINSLVSKLGNNLYEITTAQIDAVRNELSSIYGMDNLKDILL